MATVYLKRGSWYAGFKDGGGVWRYLKTTAATKTEAKRIAAEMERTGERQRLGLEQLPADSRITLAQLIEWYLTHCVKPRRQYDERKRFKRHVLDAAVGQIVTSGEDRDHFQRHHRGPWDHPLISSQFFARSDSANAAQG